MTLRRNILGLALLAVACGLMLLAPALARADDKKPKGDYLAIEGLAANVLRTAGGHGVMTVEAGVYAEDPALRTYADTVLPRLRDAYARVLQAYAGQLTTGMVPDVDYLARQLQTATDHVLGKPGAQVLLGGVMVN